VKCSSDTTLTPDLIPAQLREHIGANISTQKFIQFSAAIYLKKQAQNSRKEQIFASNHLGSSVKS
jgi:hypothetical protein